MSDPSASIAVSSIIADIAPYIVSLVTVVGIPWAVAELRAHTKIQLSQAQLAKLDTIAKAEAGALIAASQTNLAGVSIPVGSKMIEEAADRVLDAAPKILGDLGLSPGAVATMVAGHVGFAQASAPTLPVPIK